MSLQRHLILTLWKGWLPVYGSSAKLSFHTLFGTLFGLSFPEDYFRVIFNRLSLITELFVQTSVPGILEIVFKSIISDVIDDLHLYDISVLESSAHIFFLFQILNLFCISFFDLLVFAKATQGVINQNKKNYVPAFQQLQYYFHAIIQQGSHSYEKVKFPDQDQNQNQFFHHPMAHFQLVIVMKDTRNIWEISFGNIITKKMLQR